MANTTSSDPLPAPDPPPGSVEYQQLHIGDDQRPAIVASLGVMLAVTTVVVALRVWSRRFMRVYLGVDDVTILIALMLLGCLAIVGIVQVHLGLGRHTILVAPGDLNYLVLASITFHVVYISCLSVAKISILLLYHRLFATPTFKKILLTAGVAVVVWWILFSLLLILRCSPVNAGWELNIQGQCISVDIIFKLETSFNIVTEAVILVLPIPRVWKLQISRKQKISLSCLFLLGTLSCVSSAIRLPYTLRLHSPTDPAWEGVQSGIWSMAEPSIAIICACLPMFRALMRKYILKKPTNTDSSDYTPRYFSSNTDPVSPYTLRPVPGQRLIASITSIAEYSPRPPTQKFSSQSGLKQARFSPTVYSTEKDGSEPAIPEAARSNRTSKEGTFLLPESR